MHRNTRGGFVFKVNVSTGVLLSPICTGGCALLAQTPSGDPGALFRSEIRNFPSVGRKNQELNPIPAPGHSCGASRGTEELHRSGGTSLILPGLVPGCSHRIRGTSEIQELCLPQNQVNIEQTAQGLSQEVGIMLQPSL